MVSLKVKAPLGWSRTEDGAVVRESYVNLIPTPAGGTHESGLREGLFGAVKSFAEMPLAVAERR